MKVKQIAMLLGLVCLAVAGLVTLRGSRSPISATFLGCRNADGVCQATVSLSNTRESAYRCWIVLGSSRVGREQELQLSLPTLAALSGKASTGAMITVPPGDGPARVTCVVMIVDRHSPCVRWLGELLQKMRIYVYHSSPPGAVGIYGSFPQQPSALANASNLRIQIGGTKPAGSLSDYLAFQCYSNGWTVPGTSRGVE